MSDAAPHGPGSPHAVRPLSGAGGPVVGDSTVGLVRVVRADVAAAVGGVVTWVASTVRRVCAGLWCLLVAAVVVALVPSEAWSVPPSPVPLPPVGGQVNAWHCQPGSTPSPTTTPVPTTWASPLPPLGTSTTPAPTVSAAPTAVPSPYGQDCAVTGYASPNPASTAAVVVQVTVPPGQSSGCLDPASSPTPSASPAGASPSPSPSPSAAYGPGFGVCAVTLEQSQWRGLLWILATLLLIAVAGFVVRYSARVKRIGT